MEIEKFQVVFSIHLVVVNGTDLSSSCDRDRYNYNITLSSSFVTFCPSNSSDYKWKLCNIPERYGFDFLEMIYKSPYLSKIESERQTDVVIMWLSLLHGNILSTFYLVPNILPDSWSYYIIIGDYLYDVSIYTSMTLVIERLDYNPSFPMTQCALSELLSWVSGLLNYV